MAIKVTNEYFPDNIDIQELIDSYDLDQAAENGQCHHVPDEYEDGVPFCIDCGALLCGAKAYGR